MIKIECGDCRHDLNSGDLIFCEDCFKEKETACDKLEEKVSEKDREIESFEKDVGKLEEKIRENDNLIRLLNVKISELEVVIG